jgi:hypothetical protein
MRDYNFVENVSNVERLLVFGIVQVAKVAVLLLDQQLGQENIFQIVEMQIFFEHNRIVSWPEDFKLSIFLELKFICL